MTKREQYLRQPPYSVTQPEKEAFFRRELSALSAEHRASCLPYARLCRALDTDTPLLPVSAFREQELYSVPRSRIIREVTSSGTSRQQPSRIFLDAETASLQQFALLQIMQDHLGRERLPMLIIDARRAAAGDPSYSARRAGIAGFAMLSSSRTFALDENMQPDMDTILRFAEEHRGRKTLIFGFTYMVRQYFLLPLLEAGIRPDLSEAVLIHGGGWKKMEELSASPDVFKRELLRAAGIRHVLNYYGMAEQLGSIFMECECGHLHAARYSDIRILRPDDFSPCRTGEQGIVSLDSILPVSYPGHRILTEDLGRILGEDDCPCGRKGRYFAIDGRVPRAEIRGCSDTFAARQMHDPVPRIELLAGELPKKSSPGLPCFSPHVLTFLEALSENIRKDPSCRAYPEVISFGFWLRRSHLEQLRSRYPEARHGIGHVLISAPSNMPALFAYNWTAALLAGSSCVIRISEKEHPVSAGLCRQIGTVLAREEFTDLRSRTAIVRFPHEDDILKDLSRESAARIFWGSDETVRHLSGIPAGADCRDILFPDRWSAALLSADAVRSLSGDDLRLLCDRFYRDTYEADQNACSSPKLVFWIEDMAPGHLRDTEAQDVRDRWWTSLAGIVSERWHPDTSALPDKYSLVVRHAMAAEDLTIRQYADGDVVTAVLPAGSLDGTWITRIGEARLGFFYETVLPALSALPADLGDRLQTAAVFGFDPADASAALCRTRSYDALRVVPVGEALTFDLTWDGQDLIRLLSAPDTFCFWDRNKNYADRTMLVCPDGTSLSYREIWELQDLLLEQVPQGSLVFLLCRNETVPVTVYLGCLQKRCVPLLLPPDIAEERLNALKELYHPSFILVPSEQSLSLTANKADDPADAAAGQRPSACRYAVLWQKAQWILLRTGETGPALHPDLALLLSTSGSTGSPKLVRISRSELQSNAEAIAGCLQITENDRPVTSLPMEYTYGLSVINSHLLQGAAVLLTYAGILDSRFWKFFRTAGATSFAGVPYSYRLLKRIGFFSMDLPSLTVLTQAGGKLPEELQQEFGEWARGKGIRFYIMYGQTEATARMSCLPPDRCLEKPGSIGIPIPGGSFSLTDEGELVYRGPNVSMGCAENADDLCRGDENHGILYTGDLACADEDGYYYITGRKSRFVKISGRRVSLDDLESLLAGQDPGRTCLCTGNDDMIRVAVIQQPLPDKKTAEEITESIHAFLSSQTGIRYTMIRVLFMTEIPRTASGKIAYDRIYSSKSERTDLSG